ncbi:hypothetical protein [Frisingicoccus sp.]|uniref:hypothetical protein n=1 Tax=Frisingicoccus sp. TaxID=1918627 RepID=UPI003AB8F1CE
MYVKRKLAVGDLMPVIQIIKKIGIKDFKKCFTGVDISGFQSNKDAAKEDLVEMPENEAQEVAGKESAFEKIGFSVALDVVDVLLTNIPKCEHDLYAFMASMCCVTEDELKEYPISAFVDILFEVFTAEEAKDFFTHAARLMK